MQPIVLLARERSACAAEWGSNPRRSTTRMIRACSSGLVCGSRFRTRLTLLTDTPACAATSRMVGRAVGVGWVLAIGPACPLSRPKCPDSLAFEPAQSKIDMVLETLLCASFLL